MVKRPIMMFVVFAVIISVALWGFLSRPAGFLPTEDQGYGVLLCQLPEGASLDRNAQMAEKIDAILKQTQGVSGWVTIGGVRPANVSNISTTFVVYEDWKKRGQALSQDVILGHINQQLFGLQDARAIVVVPPPIRGLGQTGGFQMMVEDRQSLGLQELQKATNGIIQAGNAQPSLERLLTSFSAYSPQLYLNIDRTKAQALQVPMANVFSALQGFLGSRSGNFFNKFNQVFQVYIQAASSYRIDTRDIKNLYVRNQAARVTWTPLSAERTQGSELITRYNLYPAAPIFGSAAPQSSSGEALALMENSRRAFCLAVHVL